MPAPTETKGKPDGFPKYYTNPNGSSTRKFYRVNEEWSVTKKGYNAVWVDAEGKEHQCAIYSGDYNVLEEISKEKAMALIRKPVFPYYVIPTYSSSSFAYWRIDSIAGGIAFCFDGTTEKCCYISQNSSSSKLVSKEEAEARLKSSGFPKYLIPFSPNTVVAYYLMDSKRSGLSVWKNGSQTKVDWEPDSDLVREGTIQEAHSRLNSNKQATNVNAPSKGITIREAVRRLESEFTPKHGAPYFYSDKVAVKIIMGAYKKSSGCRRVSLREALRWAKQKSAK